MRGPRQIAVVGEEAVRHLWRLVRGVGWLLLAAACGLVLLVFGRGERRRPRGSTS